MNHPFCNRNRNFVFHILLSEAENTDCDKFIQDNRYQILWKILQKQF